MYRFEKQLSRQEVARRTLGTKHAAKKAIGMPELLNRSEKPKPVDWRQSGNERELATYLAQGKECCDQQISRVQELEAIVKTSIGKYSRCAQLIRSLQYGNYAEYS